MRVHSSLEDQLASVCLATTTVMLVGGALILALGTIGYVITAIAWVAFIAAWCRTMPPQPVPRRSEEPRSDPRTIESARRRAEGID